LFIAPAIRFLQSLLLVKLTLNIRSAMRKIVVRRFRSARPLAGDVESVARRTDSGPADGIVIRKFDPTMLELGDVSAPCQEKDAIVAVFDLTGFTAFCNQVDAHLAIPRFLSDFLDWLFTNIRRRITERDPGGNGAILAEVPMMVKFLGDGLLILWNARRMEEDRVCRIAVSLFEITHAYQREFYPRINMIVDKPPSMLRCGIARGKVFSVGGGRDYVGHCINNASRLAHLGVSFCFPHRGFQVRDFLPAKYMQIFVPKLVPIRGVGDDELIWVVRDEFERLPVGNKSMFRDPAIPGREMAREVRKSL
jgi:class 3 adenylate cyclase